MNLVAGIQFDWPSFWSAWGDIAHGLKITVELTVLSMLIGSSAGMVIALLRLSPNWIVRVGSTAWVEFWRATPLLLQLYWLYYVMPAQFGILLPAFATGLFGLSANVSAYLSETFRAGIVSIRPGQRHAALALGMTSLQMNLRVVLPQAFRRVLPAVASTWVSLFKDTSLVSTIAISDMTYQAVALRTRNFRTLEVLTALGLMYLALGYPQAKLADWVHRRIAFNE